MAATTPMDGEGCWKFPSASDVLAEILTRLPPSSRRLSRLVCRLWRDVVDQRTPEMRNRAVLLVQTWSSCYVVDDLSSGRRGALWTGCAGGRYESICVVGTCNGLVCLCDTKEPGGGSPWPTRSRARRCSFPCCRAPTSMLSRAAGETAGS